MEEEIILTAGNVDDSLPTELVDEILTNLDPFELSRWATLSRENIMRTSDPRFWKHIWSLAPANARTGVKNPIALFVEGEGLQGNKPEDVLLLPRLESFLAKEGQRGPRRVEDIPKHFDTMVDIISAYKKVYTKAWIKNQYPNRTFKLGDIHAKYRWLLQLWYLSDKGIEMHSVIKEPTTPRARLIVAYWNPSRRNEEGYNGELARIDWAPQGNRSNPDIPTFSAIAYNAQTSQTEEVPVPVINSSPNLPANLKYRPRHSDPEYVNYFAPVVPNTVIQFTELTAYRNHDLMVHFKGRVTAWDIIKVLLSPGDRSWARLWSEDEIPGQETQFHLQHTPPQGQKDYFTLYRNKMIDSYKSMSMSDPNILRKLCSELAFIINTLNSP